MALPINIENLIKGTTVESERIEFKKGWNPEAVMHTMCAFANDLHNWGGGYIIIGIEEIEGKPMLPPEGLSESDIDKIQKEIIQLGHKIQNNYFPIVEPYLFQDKHILILWCPAGDHRYYTAPAKLGKDVEDKQRDAYIRIGSQTIPARGETLRQLHELAARVPFDDRVNHQATIADLDLPLIQGYLYEIKSGLYAESAKMPFESLIRAMHIAKGPNEFLMPVNVGLLFFNKHPEDFFPYSWIEVVLFKDDSGEKFEEHYFKGPLHQQLRNALMFIQSTTIGEKVVKVDGRPEADRFYNFPYKAVEEALANAVYHKGYDQREPIEVRVRKNSISISSFPGPVPSIDEKMLKNDKHPQSREYRNRRIGDFLKELDLTEGRGTGFPTIYNVMENNGSPKPIFKTNADRTFFETILPVHKRYYEIEEHSDKQVNQTNAIKELTPRQQKIVAYVQENGSITNAISQELTSVSKRTATNDLRELVDSNVLKQTGASRDIAYQLV